MTTMDEHSGGPSAAGERRLERAIILALLSEDAEQRWACTRLAAELGVDAEALAQALQRLSHAGVVCVAGAEVWASPAVRHIDELGLIGI